MDYYTGEIRLFCGLFRDGGFMVKDWLICNGSELNKNQFPALYSVIKDSYNIATTPPNMFRLPDLGGAVPIGAGQAPGLSAYALGATGGAGTYQLTNMPAHNHSIIGTSSAANQGTPAGNLTPLSGGREGDGKYSAATPAAGSTLNITTIGAVGTSAPVNNMQPYLVLNYLICAYGVNG